MPRENPIIAALKHDLDLAEQRRNQAEAEVDLLNMQLLRFSSLVSKRKPKKANEAQADTPASATKYP